MCMWFMEELAASNSSPTTPLRRVSETGILLHALAGPGGMYFLVVGGS